MTIPTEKETTTRIHMVKTKPTKLGVIALGDITRLLRTVKGLKGRVYVVGGIVTEGTTLRDIDIVISDKGDIPQLEKALGRFAERAHFIHQKLEPPATEFVKVTGKDAGSPDLWKNTKKKGEKRLPKYEYGLPE